MHTKKLLYSEDAVSSKGRSGIFSCPDFSKTEAVAYHRQAEDPEKDDKEIGGRLHYNQFRRCKKLWIK